MSQFIVVYRRSTGTLLELVELAVDRESALAERFAREAREKDDPDVEVVMLNAPSREALVRTHARYFKTPSELLAALGEALPR